VKNFVETMQDAENKKVLDDAKQRRIQVEAMRDEKGNKVIIERWNVTDYERGPGKVKKY
jgi:hypothetical protein